MLDIADRYILTYFRGAEEVGFYSLAYSMVMLLFTACSTIPTVMYPYISEAWTKKKSKANLLFNISLKYGLIILIPGMIGTFLLREGIITLLSGPRYLISASLVPFLILFPLINFLIHLFTQDITLQEHTKKIAKLYLIAGVVNIILNIMFIPEYGMYAAAVTTIISYAILFLLLYRSSKIEWNWKYLSILKMITASIIMGIIVYFIPVNTLLMKIVAISLGAIIYFSVLLILNPFIKEEWNIFKKFLRMNDKSI